MQVIQFIASRVYTFFAFLGELATAGLYDIIHGSSVPIRADNPFNDFTWSFDVSIGGLASDILSWLYDTLNLPTDLTVFDCVLFVFASVFVITFVVRIYSMITPD